MRRVKVPVRIATVEAAGSRYRLYRTPCGGSRGYFILLLPTVPSRCQDVMEDLSVNNILVTVPRLSFFVEIILDKRSTVAYSSKSM